MTRQDLEDERRTLEDRLSEIQRFLSAGQLAYSLNIIRKLLVDGKSAEALAEFDGLMLKDLMKLHGYEWR